MQKKLKKILALLYYFILVLNIYAEEKEISKLPLVLHAFIDSYYSKNGNNSGAKDRNYTTQAIRNNEFAINLAHIGISIEQEKFRGKLLFQYGTSVVTNYSGEPRDTGASSPSVTQASVRNIQEGYAGYRLTRNTWWDTGIFFSHVGFESWISHKNWNYTRSYSLDHVPYYVSGTRFVTEFSDKFSTQILLVTGWQLISDNNKDKSLGIQLSYKFNSVWKIHSNHWFGNEVPSNERKQNRYYHNLILEGGITEKILLGITFDAGMQNTEYDYLYTPIIEEGYRKVPGKAYRHWYDGAFYAKFIINNEWSLGCKLERYYDPTEVMIQTNAKKGFAVTTGSLTLNYKPEDYLMVRLEGRMNHSTDQKIFRYDKTDYAKDEMLLIGNVSFFYN
ncbi:porin [Candidatus Nomurabacteria bacterium]|nr:porin [Candidatus Nomurabacteria bacterium]